MKFSIIVPTYNVEPYVAECIGSLKRQTFEDFEVLMVDDGSTDATVQVAREAVGDDARFRFFQQPRNAGQSAARNVALDQAAGDFVLFLDSDDYYVDHALQRLSDRLDDHKLDQLFFAATTLYENRRLQRERYEDQESRASIDGVMSGADLYVAFEKTEAFRPSSCLYAIDRSVIERAHVRFREGIIHEDLLFLMETFPLTRRTEFLNEPLYRRRMREGSTMTSAFSMRNVQGLFVVAQTMRAWMGEHAAEFGTDFCDAYSFRIAHTYDVAARYLFEIPEAEVLAYRDSLRGVQRVDFDINVLEHFHFIKGVYDELTGSRTYRLGRVFMAFPSWVKSRLALPKPN